MNYQDLIHGALSTARKTVKDGSKRAVIPRIIKLPNTSGGTLPLIPIFAGLSALGALTNGVSGIVKAMNEVKLAKKDLNESKRHNRTMESIAMGRGLFLRPYKSGLGVKLRLEKKKKCTEKKTHKFTQPTIDQHRSYEIFENSEDSLFSWHFYEKFTTAKWSKIE